MDGIKTRQEFRPADTIGAVDGAYHWPLLLAGCVFASSTTAATPGQVRRSTVSGRLQKRFGLCLCGICVFLFHKSVVGRAAHCCFDVGTVGHRLR